jgi:hypothetical protein
MLSKTQVKEWFNRYKHAELAYMLHLDHNSVQDFSGLTTAYLITFAEYFTFYSVIIGRTYWRCYKRTGQDNKKTGFKAVVLIIKNVLIEFGPAF